MKAQELINILENHKDKRIIIEIMDADYSGLNQYDTIEEFQVDFYTIVDTGKDKIWQKTGKDYMRLNWADKVNSSMKDLGLPKLNEEEIKRKWNNLKREDVVVISSK